MRASPRRPLFPLAVLAASLVFLGWLWLLSSQIRQMQMIFTYVTALFGGGALLVWWAVAGGGSSRARWAPLLAVVAAAAIFAATFKVKGITGDWLPVLEPRFARRAEVKVLETADTARAETVDSREVGTIDPAPRDFPRFLGPTGDSVVRGVRLERDWTAHPPRLVWQRPVGAAWSGFAIAGGRAFTMEQRGELETVAAYDLARGSELWSHGDRAFFTNPMAGPGPRATPTVAGGRVFTFGSTGLLSAFDAASGRLLWQHDVPREHGARIPEHGMTGSPLAIGGLVVASAGGPNGHSLAAYDQETGDLAWSGGDDRAGYGSPALVGLAGRRQILVFNQASVAGHDPGSGAVVWSHPWPRDWPNVAPPVVVGDDRVILSTGYGIGAKMLRVRAGGRGALAAELVWETRRLKSKFANLVLHQGFVYGLDDGVLVCLDPQTGERRWKGGRYGHGNLLLVLEPAPAMPGAPSASGERSGEESRAGLLLVQTERGEMVLVDPTPQEHRELARFLALRGKAWNPFALAGDHLLVRNDQEAALWRLPVAGSGSPGVLSE